MKIAGKNANGRGAFLCENNSISVKKIECYGTNWNDMDKLVDV
jgi:hypothetical protein